MAIVAIEKSSFGARRLDGDVLPPGGDIGYSEEEGDDDGDEELQSWSLEAESDDTDVSEVDSGMGSDDYDLSELGEAGSESCQVGNQSFLIPLELYDLPDLSSILSLDTWNNCLTEEERFALAEYLPDVDQETYAQTLKELFSGSNFHFGSPVAELFKRLKGGLCVPRVYMYHHCLNLFQRRQHYHQLQKYQNSMVDGLVRMRDAWENYTGYGIEERLRLLNILRSQRPLGDRRNGDMGSATDSENDESVGGYWNKRLKMGQRCMHPLKSSLDALSDGSGTTLEVNKHGKGHSKGILKVSGAKASKGESIGMPRRLHMPTHGLEMKHRSSASSVALPRQDNIGLDSGAARRIRSQTRDDDDDDIEEQLNVMTVPRGKKGTRASHLVKATSYNHHPFDSLEKDTYTEWNRPVKEYLQRLMPKGAQTDKLSAKELCHHKQAQTETSCMDPESNIKSKKCKWKQDRKVKTFNFKTLSAQKDELYAHSSHRANVSSTRATGKSSQNGRKMDCIRGSGLFDRNEETESDLSERVQQEGDVNVLSRKLRHSGGPLENHQSETVISAYETKKIKKHTKKYRREHSPCLDAGCVPHVPDASAPSQKGKHNTKSSATILEGYSTECFSVSVKLSGKHQNGVKLMKKKKMQGDYGDGLELTLWEVHTTEPKREAMIDPHCTVSQEKYVQGYENGILNEEGDFGESFRLMDGQVHANKAANRGAITENVVPKVDHHGKSKMTLMGCNLATKRQKWEAEDNHLVELEKPVSAQSSPKRQINDPILKRKKAKKRSGSVTGSFSMIAPDAIMLEKEPMDAEPEPLPTKQPFTLITPTVHTGFSFSIIHLLSAIRKAMTTINIEDTMEIDSRPEKNDGRWGRVREDSRVKGSLSHVDLEGSSLDEQKNLPSLTVQEILNCVRTNPGDPCILETQEPLQDLVRGVLKIFSSKTAPLGAKGWKALVFYEKSTKSWSWVGPVPSSSSDHDAAEEETSSEAWGIPHKMLVKLVDAFANWLKSGQETLKQIGSLPAPPVMMLPNLDERERFKDLRAQKSLVTISPSSEEVRAYFRREEFLRYSVPDRAFSYTAADGGKSTVAPLRRGGGKPTSKARDHFMLKPDRPPHVTILCLVRDAAARLPGSFGTRADVCTLIRDSQYLVEDVSDAQINSVVSGALDRLHYEQDPCVQFDGERKLWVYLHREREEEDFEDDGTSSTKKWKRPRRYATEQADMMQITDLGCSVIRDQDAGDPAVYEFSSDPNIDSTSVHTDAKPEFFYSDPRSGMENVEPLIDSVESSMHQEHPMGWEVLDVNILQENRVLCQENSTNEDFDDEVFTRGRPGGLIDASLM